MIHLLLADAVVLAHLGFVLFVLLGGLLALRWRRAAWIHLPAALWGIGIEFGGWICPLTPLENWLRSRGGAPVYEGGFVERAILPILYPAALGRGTQLALGAFALAANIVVYGVLLMRRRTGGPGRRHR